MASTGHALRLDRTLSGTGDSMHIGKHHSAGINLMSSAVAANRGSLAANNDDMSSSKKRAKSISAEDGIDGEDRKPKKTRQTQSCDACRARKVKCDRPPPGTPSEPSLSTKDMCTHCRQLGMACTFEYKPKKRGPPNMYLKRMQALNDTSGHGQDTTQTPTPPFLQHSPGAPSNLALQKASPIDPTDNVGGSGGPGPGTLAQQNAMHRSALSMQGAGGSPLLRGRDAVEDWTPALAMTVAAHQRNNGTHLSPPGFLPMERTPMGIPVYPPLHPPASMPASIPSSTPSYSSPYQPTVSNPSTNPIDAIIPRGLLLHIIDLYFDYVYCLVPCLHRPTFMRDLNGRREERPGEDEWMALVFAVVELTLIQTPRAFVSMPRREVKPLFMRSHLLVKAFLDKEFHQLTVARNIILYFHGVATYHMGTPYMSDQLFGANHALSLRLRLHEEVSYKPLNPIERELRRRIFWLQYGGDKTIAAIDGSSVFWHESDCADVTLPSPLDDEYITETGYLEQPEGHTPVLAGFYYISKLFRLLGQIIEKRRGDKARPPSGLMLQMRINEVEQLFEQVMSLMDDCPEALKLDMGGTPGARMDAIEEDWDAHVSADIRQLLLDPSAKAGRALVKDKFLVQQANIYVTQQMVRYIVLQYRDELAFLQESEIAQQEGLPNDPPGVRSRGRLSLTRRQERTMFSEAEKDQVASDLLVILSKIRIEVIAVNSYALVSKVRFVASTLLDALQTPPAQGAPHPTPEILRASERTARAQSYLWDFLRILSDIEALYVMEDDE